MKSSISIASLVLAILLLAPGYSFAGPSADDLGKCLVQSTTPEDKSLLVRWMFTTMALHPKVRDLASVSDERRAEVSKAAAGLFQSLLTKSCRSEVITALRTEGASTFESSFNVLGQVAGRELFLDPNVAAGTAALVQFLDLAAVAAALQ